MIILKEIKKSNIKKILILRLSSLGDVLLTTPLLRILSQKFPESKIDYVVSEPLKDLLKNNPYISNLLIYDKSKSIFNPFHNSNHLENNYDLLIDLQRNLRTKLLSINRAKIIRKYSKRRIHKLSLVYFKKEIINNFSVPLNYIDSIKMTALNDDGLGLEFWLKKDREANVYLPHTKEKNKNQEKVITIAPGAKHFTKRWSPEGFIELIEKLNKSYQCSINLVGSNSEVDICNQIVKGVNFDIKNYCGKLSIEETAELIDLSDLVVSNDSGIMHIAASRKIPVVVIYGSTVPEFGFLPFRTRFEILQIDLSCRPCSHIGREKCPKKHFNCMKLITADNLMSKVQKILIDNT